jgi:Rad3-related DNA helicase
MLLPSGVYSIQDMRKLVPPPLPPPHCCGYDVTADSGQGEERGLCPYFMARRMLAQANIVVYAYQYLLDQRIARVVSQELGRDSVIVFDEAHNIGVRRRPGRGGC